MFRIELSPDKPMFTEPRSDRSPGGKPEAVFCTGRRNPLDPLLLPVPYRRARLEPNAAKAIDCVLGGCASCLVMDLSRLDPPALSALVQLRLMRPDLEIILLQEGAETAWLQGTVLEDLPLIRIRRDDSMDRTRQRIRRVVPPRTRPSR